MCIVLSIVMKNRFCTKAGYGWEAETSTAQSSHRRLWNITGYVACYIITFINPTTVTLCRWSAKQMIPLSVLARNQTKGFGLKISEWPEVGKGMREGSWTKGLKEGSWRRTGQSTPDSRETSRMRWGPGQWGRPVRIGWHS